MCNCGCLVFIHSNLMATSSPVDILMPVNKTHTLVLQQLIDNKLAIQK